MPAEHGGAAEPFTFQVQFSEAPKVSFRVLRDQSFAVTGGTVEKARRVGGRNDLREIHVEPTGNGNVTLTLAGGRACGTTGAICTADGRVTAMHASALARARALGPLPASRRHPPLMARPVVLDATTAPACRAAADTVTLPAVPGTAALYRVVPGANFVCAEVAASSSGTALPSGAASDSDARPASIMATAADRTVTVTVSAPVRSVTPGWSMPRPVTMSLK